MKKHTLKIKKADRPAIVKIVEENRIEDYGFSPFPNADDYSYLVLRCDLPVLVSMCIDFGRNNLNLELK